MTWKFRSIFSKFKSVQKNGSQLRPKKQSFEPVESLEQRLCLGSMHAHVTEWTQPELTSESSELVLADDSLTGLPYREDLPPIDDFDSASANEDIADSVSDQNTSKTNAQNKSVVFSAIDAKLGSAISEETVGDADQGVPSTLALNSIQANNLSAETAQTANQIQYRPASHLTQSQASTASNNTNQVASNSTRPNESRIDTATLNSIGFQLDEDGNAYAYANSEIARESNYDAWWIGADEPVTIKYDFRDFQGFENQITEQQKDIAIQALSAWSDATDRNVVFELDTEAASNRIINIGVGDLAAVGHVSGEGSVLGLGGGQVTTDNGQFVANGLAWLDNAERWDNEIGNGNPDGTIDFSTVIAHEIGHTIGYGDQYGQSNNAMNGTYSGELGLDSIHNAAEYGYLNRTVVAQEQADQIELQPMTTDHVQLTEAEVEQLLQRAAAASPSNDAIIAVVDRNGRILGVRVESEVMNGITSDADLVFKIDGAVAKARTAAMFSNGDPVNGSLAPITSRTIRFLSQSTITQREVESNPNVDGDSLATALASTVRGPGFVAPIGVGGHFPPEINFTPLVDLFGIEHTNRDSVLHPGPDGIKGTSDDIGLDQRFNIDPNFVPAGRSLASPESFGHNQNSGLLRTAQSRGIATLPGGVPIFRDTDTVGPKDGFGDTLVGGIGVFFPGPDGFATHEQGFQAGIGQTEAQRTNAPKVIEAELIALAAVGGSRGAQLKGVDGALVGELGGVERVPNLDLPFGRLDLVGIQLQGFGPTAGKEGLKKVLELGETIGVGTGDPDSGVDQDVNGSGADGIYRNGVSVPMGWLVEPHASEDGSLTAADVEQIINNARTAAQEVRAAIRLPLSQPTRMVFAVTDTTGEVLGLFRMRDATTFSIDVAVAKARNTAYYADAADVQDVDLVGDPGVAFTNRTFRFLAQPRFPSGIDGTEPAPFSTLHDGNVDPLTAENLGAPAPVRDFIDTVRDDTPSVYGRDAFFPNTNFNDPGDGLDGNGDDTIANQNGIVFFPGSTPLYKDGQLVGGFGVSGDGVDQDDVVTYVGATGFLPESHGALRADQTFVRDIRLPYQKFLRNPFGGLA